MKRNNLEILDADEAYGFSFARKWLLWKHFMPFRVNYVSYQIKY